MKVFLYSEGTAHWLKDSSLQNEEEKQMRVLEKISDFVGKYMAILVLAVAALALFVPQSVSFINTLLGIVMFGMGLTLKASDFKVVFSRPKDIIIGAVAQFTIMPLLAFVLTKLFQLPPELAVGVILVGTCPGGTSSNVMTYRCGPVCWHDRRLHHSCTVPDSASN